MRKVAEGKGGPFAGNASFRMTGAPMRGRGASRSGSVPRGMMKLPLARFAAVSALVSALAPFAMTACSSSNSVTSTTDACESARACCESLATAQTSACKSQLSTATSQSNPQEACGILIDGYKRSGLCGGSGSTDGGTPHPDHDSGSQMGSDGAVVNNGSVKLSVVSSVQMSTIANSNAAQGSIYVVVNLALDNESALPLPLATTLFALDVTNGLEYRGDGITQAYANGCDPATSLTSDHTAQCAVVFQTPIAAVPSLLVYTLPTGGTVTAPVTTQTCSLCNGVCVDLETDPENCGACGNAVDPSGSCVGGQPTCNGAALTNCAGACVDTDSDANNCGACGKTCGIPLFAPGTCRQGRCVTEKTSTTAKSCDSVCAPAACYDANADYDTTNFSSPGCSDGEWPLDSCSTVPAQTMDPNGCGYTLTQVLCECAD